MPDPHSDKSRRLEVDRVHGNGRVTAFLPIRIVGDAAAFLASIIGANLPIPRIFRKAAFGSFDFNRTRSVVRPERTVAAADRTIAARQSARYSRNMDSNRAAVARSNKGKIGVRHNNRFR